MLLVAMVLGVLLIRKIPERWFRCLFLTCILMNVIYRTGFLSPALEGGIQLVCKSMELVLSIVAFKVFDKRPVSLSIGVLSLLFESENQKKFHKCIRMKKVTGKGCEFDEIHMDLQRSEHVEQLLL